MRRYELFDAQWRRIAPLFPNERHHGGRGHPFNPHRPIVQGILWLLHTGAPWRDLPQRYGPWQTAYRRFAAWRRDGTWNKILTRLLYRRDRKGLIRHDLWCVDATIIRATRAAAGARRHNRQRLRLGGTAATQQEEAPDHALGRCRGGFSTKVHLVVDGNGQVLAVWLSPGQRNDSKGFEAVLRRVQLPRRPGGWRWPVRLAADKGYSFPGIRRWLRRRRVRAVIPQRSDQRKRHEIPLDKRTYRRRNIIERVIGWYKECRRLVTRFEKLAVNYLAFWIVAVIEKLLRKHL
jgi:transposase